MSEEQMPPMGPDDEYEDPALDYDAEYDDVDEEIDPQEVEMVISALNELVERIGSQTIKDYLSATCEDIAYLVDEYEETDEEEYDDGGQAEAA